jgi:hypothetical protein
MRTMGRAALVIVLLTGGCADPSRPEPAATRFHGDEEMVAEWRAATDRLTLPPGVRWPAPPVLPPAPDADGVMRDHVYEVGWGTVSAESRWFCLWAAEWLAQRAVDQVRARTALASLRGYRATYSYRENPDRSTPRHYDQMLTQAGQGDDTLVRRHVEVTCAT